MEEKAYEKREFEDDNFTLVYNTVDSDNRFHFWQKLGVMRPIKEQVDLAIGFLSEVRRKLE